MRARVIYDGQELKLESSAIHQAAEEGIAIVYQELTLVPAMTVGENIFLGREPAERGSITWDKLYATHRASWTKYQLDVHPQDVVKDLGVGKMQMTEIAKALSEDAQVLILDEPTSALSEAEIDKLMEILRTLEGTRRDVHLHHPQDERVLPHHRYRDRDARREDASRRSRPRM